MEKSIPYSQETERKPAKKRGFLSGALVAGFGLFSVLYLLAPSLIPDAIPIIGALDEAAATAILISALAYFGLDFGRLFGHPPAKKTTRDESAVEVESEVVGRD